MISEELFGKCNMPEFVGCAALDTIGLVIPSPDESIRDAMRLPDDIRSLGLVSSRTGAAGQILAVDEAVKMTDTVVVSIELPRDTKGWGGHGNYIVIGGRTVDDARHAVKIALGLVDVNSGEVYISDAGHLEFAYTAKAGDAISIAFGAEKGRAFGFMAASPAAIGLLIADRALKESSSSLVRFMTPNVGTSHSNEVIAAICGEASDVKNAVITAKKAGIELLRAMGSEPVPQNAPYIV